MAEQELECQLEEEKARRDMLVTRGYVKDRESAGQEKQLELSRCAVGRGGGEGGGGCYRVFARGGLRVGGSRRGVGGMALWTTPMSESHHPQVYGAVETKNLVHMEAQLFFSFARGKILALIDVDP